MNCQTWFENGKWNNLATWILEYHAVIKQFQPKRVSFDVYSIQVYVAWHTRKHKTNENSLLEHT